MKNKQLDQKEQSPIILQSDKVSVNFGGFYAIKEFDFSIPQGELHFLIGPNGAGKTTFLDAICGKTKYSEGTLIFDGKENLARLKEFKIVRAGIGRKFQAPSTFPHLKVTDNLELAMKQDKRVFPMLFSKMKSEDKGKIEAMLELIGLKEQRGTIAKNLSHGQKQWLEIGMVMMQEPKLLLLDEPIAGMTEEEEHKTGELLLELKKSCSIIVVEHDMDFVRKYAEKVTVMHGGQWLCDGTMDEVQNNERVMEVYLGRKGEDSHAEAI
ncbi:urea ABC transporter ATP-binding protein UrtD [Desertibacillus haloalkaliphilus]|uniref:urea ABC transporter ATP-binding protein UrtD n=1 Tax=Desertibacillus haloalkaliphilus TaxID=1328930 RepID=UPI001C27BB49|nr:urea ABC transporter ATP-binding protein UrtD [Desertibacillus haloalkaliphilus]MBU8908797.1 urea ABC transporter ATP-binding protein UrtD [Desertibacillus haloalkaliphilus]